MEFAKGQLRTAPLSVLLVLLFIQVSSGMCFAQSTQTNGNSECDGDTVDSMGREIATQSRVFLAMLGKAVQVGDQRQVASMLRYPIDVHIADKKFPVHNPQEFLKNYRLPQSSNEIGRLASIKRSAILNEESSRDAGLPDSPMHVAQSCHGLAIGECGLNRFRRKSSRSRLLTSSERSEKRVVLCL